MPERLPLTFIVHVRREAGDRQVSLPMCLPGASALLSNLSELSLASSHPLALSLIYHHAARLKSGLWAWSYPQANSPTLHYLSRTDRTRLLTLSFHFI